MKTLAENLQILVDNKAALKAVLEEKGKAPTDNMSEYASLIDELDNEEQVSYVLSNSDETQQVFAQLSSETPVTLTATENDIRLNTSAITQQGYTEGQKDIPAYRCERGIILIQKNSAINLVKSHHNLYDYTKVQATFALFNQTINNSVQVDRVTVDDSVYTANTTTKLSDLSVDHDNTAINFGITNGDTIAVMRYLIMREEA